MRIAVVDDQELFRNLISSEITSLFGRNAVQCFLYSDGNEILRAMALGLEYDAVFLDIEMKDIDGMQAAAEIRQISKTVPIIFLTSHTEMAIQGYEVSAFRFLAKPIDRQKLKETLTDLEKHIYKGINITLHVESRDIIVPVSTILYVESANNEVRFVTEQQPINVRMKLSEAQRILSEADCDFYKVHRCYIVNMKHITKFSSTEIHTSNGQIIPVSRSAALGFRTKMFEYLKQNGR